VSRTYGQYCALARGLDVVGDRWSLLIVRNLLLGPQRWSDLRAHLPGVAKNLLASRLRDLAAAGVLAECAEGYALTSAGHALRPAVGRGGGPGGVHGGRAMRK
jgi:DNA-binding HxlR family transcriptional regulator